MDIDSLRIKKFAELTGWTEGAVRMRIHRGEWMEGREFVRVNGAILISIKGYESWVEKNREHVPACLS